MIIKSFYNQTLVSLVLASGLLAAGVFFYVRGQAIQHEAQQLAEKVLEAREQIDRLDRSSKDYAELIRRIGWRPGIQLRRETVDMSGTFTGNDLTRINQMFTASYSGKGYFSLHAFKIEEAVPQGSATGLPFAVKASLRGDSILVLDPK